MTPRPKKSRARFFTVDDVESAAERLQAVVDQIKGLAAAMRADKCNDLLKIDGGDSIVDAVQLGTAWFHKVEGVYSVKKVAAAMMFRHEPPANSDGSSSVPKRRAKKASP